MMSLENSILSRSFGKIYFCVSGPGLEGVTGRYGIPDRKPITVNYVFSHSTVPRVVDPLTHGSKTYSLDSSYTIFLLSVEQRTRPSL